MTTRPGTSADELHTALLELSRRLGGLAEPQTADPQRHIDRMSRTCVVLARRLGLTERECELLRLASPWHDIGKLELPQEILRKPGPLSPAERKAIERHTELGYALLHGTGSEVLELAATIALTHHERWDGLGYPNRLAREEIPLPGRIACVADVFDALTSERPFRPAFELDAALRMMQEGRGTIFDPAVVDALVEAIDDIAIETVPSFTGARPGVERRSRRRRSETSRQGDALAVSVLEHAAADAIRALAASGDARHAIDAALAALREAVGPELLPAVYVLEHDRLWLVAQRGYDQVRDGFPLDQGIMARAHRTRSPQVLPDVALDPDYVAARRDVRSEIAIPLPDSVGVLNLETLRLRLSEEHVPVLEPFSERLAGHLAALRGELDADLAGLARLFVYASSLRGTEAIAEFATRTLARLLELESAQLSLGSVETGFSLVSYWQRPDCSLEPLSSAEVERIAAEVARTGAAYMVLDAEELPLDLGEARRWLVWLPLETGGNRIGALVGTSPRPLAPDHQHLEAATLFAPHAAALIDVAQTLRRERRAAVTDPLTGLLNRRGFERRFHEEIQRASRSGFPLALVVVDCDGLKQINDRGGHELGDSVLLHVARCIKTHKRTADVAARLGGDEFALLLPESGEEEAEVVAERLRLALVDEVLEEGQLITATFGIAVHPADGRTASDLLRAADQALYAAKQTGRNRTERYSRSIGQVAR